MRKTTAFLYRKSSTLTFKITEPPEFAKRFFFESENDCHDPLSAPTADGGQQRVHNGRYQLHLKVPHRSCSCHVPVAQALTG